MLNAAIIPDTASGPDSIEPASPPRTQRDKFFIGDTVGFTDKHLSERVGIIVRLNAKTASIAVDDSDGHRRVSYASLRKIVNISLRDSTAATQRLMHFIRGKTVSPLPFSMLAPKEASKTASAGEERDGDR